MSALSVILPGGKMGAFLKGMSRLIVFAVLAAPLLTLMTKKEFTFPAAELGEDEGYLSACARLLEEKDEREIASLLQEKFSLAATACVTRSPKAPFPMTKIRINLSSDCISGQDGHIDIADSIASALSQTFACNAADVEVVWEE